VLTRVCVREGRDQHCAGMRRHMQTIGNKRQRPKHTAAADFNQHHRATERNDRPRPALILLMSRAQKVMVVSSAERGAFEITHVLLYLK
jgi:hypothetical protein